MATIILLLQQARTWAEHRRLQFRQFFSGSFVRNVAILSGGAAIGHAFTFAIAPILTRIYGPRDFGALGLFTSFLSIAGVAVALQFEISIVSAADEEEAEYITLACLLLALPVSVVAGTVLWIFIRHSAPEFSLLPQYTAVLLAFAMCFVGVFAALRYWCLRKEQFKQVSQGVVVQSAARASLQAAIGAAGLHSAGLLLGETVGRCLGMSRMLRIAWPVLQRRVSRFRWAEFIQALKRNWKFPIYSLPSCFLDALCMGITVPLLIRLHGASVGGHFSLVWRSVTLPSVVFTGAIADTFHQRIATCAHETPDRVMRLFQCTSAGLLLLGLVPATVMWYWGEPLFLLAFGAQWGVAGTMVSLVVPWYLAQLVVSPVSRVVVVLSGQEIKLLWDVLYLGSLLATFFFAQRQGMGPTELVRMLSLVSAGMYVIYYLLLMRIIVRFTRTQELITEAAEAT